MSITNTKQIPEHNHDYTSFNNSNNNKKNKNILLEGVHKPAYTSSVKT